MIILNEKEYVEQILTEQNLEPSKTYRFLNLYAKYLYQEKNLKKTEIPNKLNAFMANHYPRYNPIDWISSLETCTNKADKYPLCNCRGIWII